MVSRLAKHCLRSAVRKAEPIRQADNAEAASLSRCRVLGRPTCAACVAFGSSTDTRSGGTGRVFREVDTRSIGADARSSEGHCLGLSRWSVPKLHRQSRDVLFLCFLQRPDLDDAMSNSAGSFRSQLNGFGEIYDFDYREASDWERRRHERRIPGLHLCVIGIAHLDGRTRDADQSAPPQKFLVVGMSIANLRRGPLIARSIAILDRHVFRHLRLPLIAELLCPVMASQRNAINDRCESEANIRTEALRRPDSACRLAAYGLESAFQRSRAKRR